MLNLKGKILKLVTIVSMVAGFLVGVNAPANANSACVLGTDYTRVSASNSANLTLRFTNTTTCVFTIPASITSVTALVVGAGGGGGGDGGSGGGGGQLRQGAVSVTAGNTMSIKIGIGGVGSSWGGVASAKGGDSTITGVATFTAIGGNPGSGWGSNTGGTGGAGGTGGTTVINGQQGGGGPGGICNPIGYGSSPTGTVPSSDLTGSTVFFGGGGGGGFGAQTNNSGNGFLGAAGGTNSGGRGANYKISSVDSSSAINGASNGYPGVANTGGGGGGGSACNARGDMNLGFDGVSQRTAGGAGANGVVFLQYSSTPSPVTNVSVASNQNSQVTITWTAPSYTGSGITGYRVQRVVSGGGWEGEVSTGSTAASYVYTGLTNGTEYFFRVTPVTDAGTAPFPGAGPFSSGIPAAPPGTPTSLSATPGNAQLSIAFTAGAANGSAISNYQYSTDSGATWKNRATGTTASPLVISTLSSSVTSLVNGTSYTVVLRAINSAGNSVDSASVTGIPNVIPTISSAPVISGTTTSGQTLTVSNGTWANNPASYTYSWSRATTSGGSYSTISGAISSTYTLGAADIGNFVRATVTATNSAGNSTASNSEPTSTAVIGTCSTPTTTTDRAFTVLRFTTVGTCSWANTIGVTTVDALIVGGGGGGGAWVGAGGGGGGFRPINSVDISGLSSITVKVGAGGSGATWTNPPVAETSGSAGGVSSFLNYEAAGGGKGAGHPPASTFSDVAPWNFVKPTSGGSGGGGTGAQSTSATIQGWTNGADGTTAQGNKGGNGLISVSAWVAGGGGGAGGVGGNGASGAGGVGGIGATSDITGTTTRYAGGGGGAHYTTPSNSGLGGAGGGGGAGTAGTANLGGGGGGGAGGNGGNGGSGVVILRYITNAPSISTQPNSATVKSFTEASFSVVTSTTPAGVNRTFQWQVSTDGGGSFSNISGANGSSYAFTAIAANDNNKKYRVVITDTATDTTLARSTTSTAATLTVSPEVAPDAPLITGITVSSTQLSVAFTAGTNNGSPITKYQYSTDNGDTWKDRATGTTESPLIITTTSAVSPANLVNGTPYNVRIRAFNSIEGIQSLAVSATPYAAPTLAAPTSGLSATAGTAYTLTIPAAAGGSNSYTYQITAGTTLPPGLSLSGRTISGTPTEARTFSGIKVTVTDTTSGLTAQSTAFSITVASGTQLELSIVTRFGTGGSPLTLFSSGGSGGGGVTYVLNPLVTQPSCSLTSGVLTANFAAGISGSCSVIATRAGLNGFTDKSSAATTIFFTAYVPVIQQTLTCPAGTVPSAPTGIGVGSCIQVLAPVSPTAGDSGAAPKITALSATSGLVGESITITGTGFSTVTRVQFGTKSTTTFTATSTTITVAVPTGATRGRVMVVSPTGTAMAAQIFTVTVLDTQAPGFTGGSVNTSSPTQLTLNFDESIDGTGVLASSFAVSVAGTNRVITGISISGTTIVLTLASAVSAGQSVDFTYTSPNSSASIKDAAGNKTATITSTRLTNNLS